MAPRKSLSELIQQLGIPESNVKAFSKETRDFIDACHLNKGQISAFEPETIDTFVDDFIETGPGEKFWPLGEDGRWFNPLGKETVKGTLRLIMSRLIENRRKNQKDHSTKTVQLEVQSDEQSNDGFQVRAKAENCEANSEAGSIYHDEETTLIAQSLKGKSVSLKSSPTQTTNGKQGWGSAEAVKSKDNLFIPRQRKYIGPARHHEPTKSTRDTAAGGPVPFSPNDPPKASDAVVISPTTPPLNPVVNTTTPRQTLSPLTPLRGIKRDADDLERSGLPPTPPTTANANPPTKTAPEPQEHSSSPEQRRVRPRFEQPSPTPTARTEEDGDKRLWPGTSLIKVRGLLYEPGRLTQIADVLLDYVSECENHSLSLHGKAVGTPQGDFYLNRASFLNEMYRDLDSRLKSMAVDWKDGKSVVSSYCMKK